MHRWARALRVVGFQKLLMVRLAVLKYYTNTPFKSEVWPSTVPPTCERYRKRSAMMDPIIGHILVSVGAAAVGVVLAPVVAVGIVGALGFSAAGVVAGAVTRHRSPGMEAN